MGGDPEEEKDARLGGPFLSMRVKVAVVGLSFFMVASVVTYVKTPLLLAAMEGIAGIDDGEDDSNQTDEGPEPATVGIYMDDFKQESGDWYWLPGMNPSWRSVTIGDGHARLDLFHHQTDYLFRVFINDNYLDMGRKWQYVGFEMRLRCSDYCRGSMFWAVSDVRFELPTGAPLNFLGFLRLADDDEDPGIAAVCKVNGSLLLREPLLGLSTSEWHNYTVFWKPGNATFLVDGGVVATTTVVPSIPLGLIVYMDNGWHSNGSTVWLAIEENQFIEVDYVRVILEREDYQERSDGIAQLLNLTGQQIETASAGGRNTSRLLSDHASFLEEWNATGYVHAERFNTMVEFLSHVDELVELFQEAALALEEFQDRDRMIMGHRYEGAEDVWMEYDYHWAKVYLEEIIRKASE